jgi:hypothetical protein
LLGARGGNRRRLLFLLRLFRHSILMMILLKDGSFRRVMAENDLPSRGWVDLGRFPNEPSDARFGIGM